MKHLLDEFADVLPATAAVSVCSQCALSISQVLRGDTEAQGHSQYHGEGKNDKSRGTSISYKHMCSERKTRGLCYVLAVQLKSCTTALPLTHKHGTQRAHVCRCTSFVQCLRTERKFSVTCSISVLLLRVLKYYVCWAFTLTR